jgi:predicted hydrocarbon binding protein
MSKRSSRVFWLNGIILVLSILFIWLEHISPIFKMLSVKSNISIMAQIALFTLSIFSGMVLTGLESQEANSDKLKKAILTAILDGVDDLKADSDKFRKELARGIVEYQGQSYRSLRYKPDTGAIYYGEVAENNRNILFNNETIKKIFQVVKDVKVGGEPVMYNSKPLLYALGYAASSRFAQHFQAYVQEKKANFELATWLREWTVYDSDAGFGNMEVIAQDSSSGDSIATVVIKKSFLTHGADRGGRESLCDFMVGYIEGLLKNFAPAIYSKAKLDRVKIRVDHDKEVECYHGHQDPERGCVFIVSVPKSS